MSNLDCDENQSCVSSSLSSSTATSKSSDWKHVYREIKKEIDLQKRDAEAIDTAKREMESGNLHIQSNQISARWVKLRASKGLSLMKDHVVMFSNDSLLCLIDMQTSKRRVFCPQPLERNNGISYYVGHPSLDVFAVSDVGIKPVVSIVEYPSMQVAAVLTDNSSGCYDSLAFSGDRMILTLKSAIKLNISIWDWKNKIRYFNIERDSYSQSLSLRGSEQTCLFSLLCLGQPTKLYLWEMSLFTDIVSLFSKHCKEDLDLDLRDQCLLDGNVYAVDVNGNVFKAQKESTDHLKFVKIIENSDEPEQVYDPSSGLFITAVSSSGLAVYGPTQTIKFYTKKAGLGWSCDRVQSMEYPLVHLLSSKTEEFLIGWDVKRGLVKIANEVTLLEDRRIISDTIDDFNLVHPDDVILVTLHIKKILNFWTVDEGYFVSEFTFNEDVHHVVSHPLIPYITVLSLTIGDIYILDVQDAKRPRLHKIIRITYDPLASLQFNAMGDYFVVAGSAMESLYLIHGNPSKSFEVTRAVITRHGFSSFGFMIGSSGHSWIVLLLASYRNYKNRYCELLTLPNMAEFIKVDLGQSYAQLLTCPSNPSTMLLVPIEDVCFTRIAIDSKRGKLSEKVVLKRLHIVPPLYTWQDRLHIVSVGQRGGYLVISTSDGEHKVRVAPHRFQGIMKAIFAPKPNCLITFSRESSLTCFDLHVPCGHTMEEHDITFTPFQPIPYSKAKTFKRIEKDDTPWDELDENQKKIHIFKKGVVRTVHRNISNKELLEILNSTNTESKLQAIHDSNGNFDSDIVIDYIRKWITHYRMQIKKFVEYNEFLEFERPAEMIPWEEIRKVETRAYAEYRQNYEQTLAKFKNSVGTSIKRWTTAYQRIVNTTWNFMYKQPTSIKMVFRDFSVQDFGFNKNYPQAYREYEKNINVNILDQLIHPRSENFIWDARLDVYPQYWNKYLTYLKDAVNYNEERDSLQKKHLEKQNEQGDDANFYGQDVGRFSDELKRDMSNIFKKKNTDTNMSFSGSTLKLGVSQKRPGESCSSALKDVIDPQHTSFVLVRESDESLFYDSDEEQIANKPKRLKKYRKRKKMALKRVGKEYPYMDEFNIDDFERIFFPPADYPDEYIFLRPGGARLLAASEGVQRVSSVGPPCDSVGDNSLPDSWRAECEKMWKADSPKKPLERNTPEENADDNDERKKNVDELMSLMKKPPPQRLYMAKKTIDDENRAAQLAAELQARQRKKKRGKKDITENIQSETVVEEIPEEIEKAEENRRKRIVTNLPEKTTDCFTVVTIDEQLLKRLTNAPTKDLAIVDLSRLYLLLDVEVLLESNRKRRKRRKSSLEREAMSKLKMKEAESKNEKMMRLLQMIHEPRTVSRRESFDDSRGLISSTERYTNDSEGDSDHDVDVGKISFTSPAPYEKENMSIKKVIIVGDVVRYKKRRILLGKIREMKPDDKLASDLIKLNIIGPVLPPEYIHNQRQVILNTINEKTINKAEEVQEFSIEEICWLNSAIKKFAESKAKKIEDESTGIKEESAEQVEEDEALTFTSKVSIISTLKGFIDKDKVDESQEPEKKEKPRLIATRNIETFEEGLEYLMEGTSATRYVSMGAYSPKQINLPSVLHLVTNRSYYNKCTLDVFNCFNDYFAKLRKVKDVVMSSIQKHQENYHYYISEIQTAVKENPVFPEMPPAVWSPKENPEMMITVTDEEVPVSRYYSPSELSLQRKLEEEEARKRRLPKPDPFRLEALQIMMDGVVERRWEDELKKDIPFPKALIGKDPEDYDKAEIEIMLKYEADVAFHNSERQRYKKILMENIDKEVEAIRDLHMGFDLRVKQLSEKLTEFVQMGKELRMLSLRRVKEKAMLISFLNAAERARTFMEATKASVDQIESLVKVLGKKMKSHKANMSAMKKRKEQREEKLEETLKKMSVITSDRSFVITNYIKPSFVINPKFMETPNILSNVLECFDTTDESTCQNPVLAEFFKDVANSLKRNVPQKLTKQIWEILAQARRENIRNDIEIAILQSEYNKAEDAAKFFKAYLKQKQSFTEMINKALEASVQRYKTSTFLQEYQLVLPMGMVEVEIGWEQDAKLPNFAELILMPAEDYESLLTDKHAAETLLISQEWKNSVTLDNIARLNATHYELIGRNKILSLNIKHIERYQLSMHSRALIKEIKESGLKLGGEKRGKAELQGVMSEADSAVKHDMGQDDFIELDLPSDLTTGKHFIFADAQSHEENFLCSDAIRESDYPKPEIASVDTKSLRYVPKLKEATETKNDLLDVKPFKYLFSDDFDYAEDISMRSVESVKSVYSMVPPTSTDKVSSLPVLSKPKRTIDRRTVSGDARYRIMETRRRRIRRKIKKDRTSFSNLIAKRLTMLRDLLLMDYYKMIKTDNKNQFDYFMSNLDGALTIHSWRGDTRVPEVDIQELSKIEVAEEEVVKQKSEFNLVRGRFILQAKMNIQKFNRIWYPKMSARDATLFKKDTGIDFKKYLEVPPDVEEFCELDIGKDDIKSELFEEAKRPGRNPKSSFIERKKREFVFSGSWPERLVALWKELEVAEETTSQLEKLIKKTKKASLADYWSYSDFNFKRSMKNNLVSLLKSYKNQVERHWKESKSMEREMTRYVEMNKKCVLLFFNYELTQNKTGGAMQEMSRRAESFTNKRSVKVEKAMRKAELLREIQRNQYEILQLQSQLELHQLRTYPILMYTTKF